MNNNISKGKWKQIRGQAKVWWGKLTNNNGKKVGGNVDKFVGKIQEKIGHNQQDNDEYRTRTK
jgi:uncharacterized protein YjbJ (UPF0337 family)